jgi:hypothetical protein
MQSYILTGSMDGTIKVWSPGSSPAEIVNTQPDFRYPEEEQQHSGGGRGYRPQVGTVQQQGRLRQG